VKIGSQLLHILRREVLTSRIAAIEAAFGRPLPINIHSLKKFAGINATLAGLERYRPSSVEGGPK
jgi:hypothetical protein